MNLQAFDQDDILIESKPLTKQEEEEINDFLRKQKEGRKPTDLKGLLSKQKPATKRRKRVASKPKRVAVK